MPTPIIPTIIQGPAVIFHNSAYFFTKGPIRLAYKRNTFFVATDVHGKIDERIQSDITEISFQPDGQVANLTKLFPWGISDVGKSIFAGGDKTVVIQTLDGRTITWQKGAVSKMPPLRLKPTDTVFGDMTITCLGKSATQRSNVSYWKAITSVAWSEATYGFDETKIKTDLYIAAWGVGAPYNSMGSMEGFDVEYQTELEEVPAVDVGIADIVLSGLTARARFRPSNLTEAQVDTLLNIQDASALYPGESLSKAGNNLVITGQGGSPLTVTISKAGPKDTNLQYGTAQYLHGVLEFGSKRTWTAGVGNALFTIA